MAKKRKRGRPPSENPMLHTAVVLPRDLLGRLKRDAERREIGLSAEIRQRLLAYEQDRDLDLLKQRDERTKDLIEAVKLLADNLNGDLGMAWHEHPYALGAFKAGVAAFLAPYHPKGDASVRPDTRVVGEPDDPPEAVGRTHARIIMAARGEGKSRRANPPWHQFASVRGRLRPARWRGACVRRSPSGTP